MICPRGAKRDTEPYALIEGVEIHRYALEAATGGPAGYLKEYGTALWQSLRIARRLDRERPFDVVQACNPPDLLFLVALPLQAARRALRVRPARPRARSCSARASARRTAAAGDRAARAGDVPARRPRDLDERELPRRGDDARARAARAHDGRAQRARPHALRRRSRPTSRCGAGKRFLVCYLGVMGPQDGVDYALRALASLRDDLGRRRRPCRLPRPRRRLGRPRRARERARPRRLRRVHRARLRRGSSRATSRPPTSASRPTRRTRSTTSRR